jgi:acetyltransferase
MSIRNSDKSPLRGAAPSYPAHLASRERLRDGALIAVRPIRPVDEPMLHDLAAHMTPEDLRLRFFVPLHALPHALAARLTQIDYDREMALVASDGAGAALGVARYSADPDRLVAEFAVAVRSDWHGRGVGHLLMNRLIDTARQQGIGELVGQVLHENRTMLAMCRKFGFALAADPADPGLVRVSKRLRG